MRRGKITDASTPSQNSLQISNSSSTTINLETVQTTVLNPDKNNLTDPPLLFDSSVNVRITLMI